MACGGCCGDRPGSGCRPVLHGRGGGGWVGLLLRLFAAIAGKAQRLLGSDLCDCVLLGVAVCGLWHLPGRSAIGLVFWHAFGRRRLGMHRRAVAAASFFGVLEGLWEALEAFGVAFQKNNWFFNKKRKKSICKM